MSEIDYSKYQKEVCEQIPEPPPLKKICPSCIPNESYIAPDWTTMVDEAYLNEKLCEYQICVTMDKEGKSYKTSDFRRYQGNSRKSFLRRFVQPALTLMLDQYGKLIADQIICANHNGPAVSGLTPQELLTNYDDFDVAFGSLMMDEWSSSLDTCPDLGVLDTPVANVRPGEPVQIMNLTAEIIAKLPQVTNPFALELYAQVKDFYIDPSQQLLKVLIGVPVYIFDRVPDAPTKKDLEEEALTTIDEVELDVDKLFGQIKRLQATMMVYSKYQSFFHQMQKGYVGFLLEDSEIEEEKKYLDFYASVYSGKIKEFYEELKDLSKDNGWNIRSNLPSAFRNNARLVKIIFKTDSDKPYQIDSIKAKKKGCEYVTYTKNLGKNTKDGFFYKWSNDPTLMNYIAKLKEIDLALRARRSYPWLDFLVQFTYPLLTVHYGKLSLRNIKKNAGECVANNAEEFGIDLRDYILDQSLNLMDAMAYQFNHLSSCSELRDMENEPEWKEFEDRVTRKEKKEFKKQVKETLDPEGQIESLQRSLEVAKVNEQDLLSVYESARAKYQSILRENRIWIDTFSDDLFAQADQEAAFDEYKGAQQALEKQRDEIKKIEAKLTRRAQRQLKRSVNKMARKSAKRYKKEGHPYVKKARELALQEFELQDSFLTTIINFDDFASQGFGGLKLNKRKKFDLKDLTDRMSVCNFKSLLKNAIRCLFAGVTEEAALRRMVEAALKAMDLDVFEIFIRNLPPESQQKLREKFEKEFGNLPLPWEEGYDPGHINNTNAYIKFLRQDRSQKEEEPESEPVEEVPPEEATEISESTIETEGEIEDDVNPLEEAEREAIQKAADASWEKYHQNDKYFSHEERVAVKEAWYTYASYNNRSPEFSAFQSWWSAQQWSGHGNNTETIQRLQSSNVASKEKEQADIDAQAQADRIAQAALDRAERAKAEQAAAALEAAKARDEEAARQAAEAAEKEANSLKGKWKNLSEKTKTRIKDGMEIQLYGPNKDELGPPGVYGKALGNMQELIVDAYIEYMLDILEIDELMSILERFPGAELLPRVINKISCSSQGLFNPPIKSFLSSFSLDICGDTGFGLAIPTQVKEIPNFYDKSILIQLQNIFVEKVETVMIEVFKRMFFKVLESIDGAICKAIHALGKSTLGSGGWGFDDAINDAFCPDADDEENKKTKDHLFESAGLAANLPQRDNALAQVGDDTFECLYTILNSTLSKSEALSLLTTPPAQMDGAVLLRIAELVNAFCPEFSSVFGTPDQIAQVFGSCGNYVPPELRSVIQDELNRVPDGPIYDSICLTQQEFDDWNNARVAILRDDGLDRATAEDMIRKANERVLDALGDLANIAQKGPDGILGEALDALLDPSRDPACAVDPSAVVFENDELAETKQAAMKDFFDNIEKTFLHELIEGRHGVLNNILRDKNNFRLKKHERRANRPLWNPDYVNSEDDWQFRKDNSNIIISSRMEEAIGTYPETVGSLMRNQLKSQNASFRSFPFGSEINFSFQDSSDPTYEFSLKYSITHDNKTTSQLVVDEVFNKKMKKKERKRLEEQGMEVENIGGSIEVAGSTDLIIQNSTMLAPYDDIQHNPQHSYESEVFENFVQNKIGSSLNVNGTIREVYTGISNTVLNFTKQSVINSSDGDIPMGFKFGYNDQRPIQFIDLLYVNPDADPNNKFTWYYSHLPGEKVLGKSATENPRVHFLDPALHGGNYLFPKIYIEPATYNGWMGMIKTFVPQIDECEEMDNGFLNTTEISKRVKEVEKMTPMDERLSLAPDCRIEAPYDKHFAPATHGIMEGVVLSTVKVYATEFILKTMPVFASVAFNEKNVDNTFISMLADEMRKGLSSQTNKFNIVQGYTYYLMFLEQAVQTVKRQIISGLIEETPEMEEAFQAIDNTITNYNPMKIDVKSYVLAAKDKTKPFPRDDLAIIQEIYRGASIIGFGEFWQDEFEQITELASPESLVAAAQRAKKGAAAGAVAGAYIGTKAALMPVGGAVAGAVYGGVAGALNDKGVKQAGNNLAMIIMKIGLLSPFKIRLARKVNALYQSREAAETIFRALLQSEVKILMKKLNYDMRPRPHVENIHKYLLSKNGIVFGSSLRSGESIIERPTLEGATGYDYGKIFNVVKDVNTENPLNEYEVKIRASSFSIPENLTLEEFITSNVSIDQLRDIPAIFERKLRRSLTFFRSGVFYMEKYLRVIEKDGTEQVYNIEEFQQILQNRTDIDPEKKISDYYGNPFIAAGTLGGSIGIKFGVRLVYSPPESFEYDTPPGKSKERTYELGPAVVKFKFEDSFYENLQDLPELVQDKVKELLSQLELSMPSAQRAIPLVVFEQDVLDKKMGELDLEDSNFGEDLKCYVDNLVQEDDFKVLFDYCFPVKSFVSLYGVYSYYGFFESIGKDEENRDEVDADPEKLREKWKSRIFRKTKKKLRRLFNSTYRSDDDEKSKEDNKESKERSADFLANLLPGAYLNLDGSVMWWQAARIVDIKPFDPDGKPCLNDFQKMFR